MAVVSRTRCRGIPPAHTNSNQGIDTIELKQIAYKYPHSRFNIISDLSCKFEINKNYAIVGKPGSGKSTLLKIVGGLYESGEGQIMINRTLLSEGQAIKNYADVMVIPQNPILFGNTIRDFLDPSDSLDDNAITDALERCDCRRVVATLPMGLHTNLSESSEDLSNAERQRFHVARVILAQPTILLSDEPTSYLDETMHRDLIKELNRSSALHISTLHRLSTRDCFDEIIDMSAFSQTI